MNYIVLIPARGGSKRIPNKNITELCGLPLIAHSINYALKNFHCKKVFVSSDNERILKISKKYGASLIKRPYEISDDHTKTVDVLKHSLNFFKNNNIDCDAIILLQPTNPIRPADLIKKSIKLFEKNSRNSLASFTVLNKKYGTISNNLFTPSNYKPGQRSQDIESQYYENGLIYITKAESILNNKIITQDVYPHILNNIFATVDIDDPDDLLYAELVMKLKVNYE